MVIIRIMIDVEECVTGEPFGSTILGPGGCTPQIFAGNVQSKLEVF